MKEFPIVELLPEHIGRAHDLITATPGVTLLEEETPGLLTEFLARNPGLSSATFDEDQLVGCMFLGNTGLRAVVHHLAVHSDYRHQGIGIGLVKRSLLTLWETTAVRRVQFGVLSENTSGRSFCLGLPACRLSTGEGGKIVVYTIDLKDDPRQWAWQ